MRFGSGRLLNQPEGTKPTSALPNVTRGVTRDRFFLKLTIENWPQVFDLSGERAGIRTLDPVIKSHVLYQLSYALTWRIKYLNSAGFTSLARLFVPLLLD